MSHKAKRCSNKMNSTEHHNLQDMVQNNISSPSTPVKYSCDASDYDLQLPAWSLRELKNMAIQQRLVRPRSLAWAIMLSALPPINSDIKISLRAHRNYYIDLKKKLSMDPRAVDGDDPLSQNDESAWNQHFCDEELKSLILLDVSRTYPDEGFFRDKKIEDMMVRVLFLWSRSHALGYRQGMHEILAPLLLELHYDRVYAPDDLLDPLKYYLQEDYLEHDSFMLFSVVMKGLERFYSTGDVVPTMSGRFPISKAVHNPNEVVRYLENVKNEYLSYHDPELFEHLAECNITMELFGIETVPQINDQWGVVIVNIDQFLPGLRTIGTICRWLRLLFGREFPRSEIPHLWSYIFSDGPMYPYLHYVVIALLISMRSILLDPEQGTVLAALMRAPRVSPGHVVAMAQHLKRPMEWPRPNPPPRETLLNYTERDTWAEEHTISPDGQHSESGSEGVPEGSDVARELAALALLRAQLPAAAAALRRALPDPPPDVARPLHQILQLASLLQCRNHALMDVETALEAAEGQNSTESTEKIGRRHLVPVTVITGKRTPVKERRQINAKREMKVKEVQLKVFNHVVCDSDRTGDLPQLDPLKMRTD